MADVVWDRPSICANTQSFHLPAVVAARVLQAYGVLYIPTVMLVVGAVLSIPLLVVARIVYAKYDLKRRAARLGAVLPPSRVGKSIGNIDILKHGIERWKNGYVGK